AQRFFRGGEVEHVINNLESHAEIAAIFGKPPLIGVAGAGENSAHLHADGKQARGLAIDELEVLVHRDGLAETVDLEQFALDHFLGEVDEGVEDVEVALLHRDLEGLHVEPVAGQYALGVAPLRVGGGTSAARLRFVDDVVVNQGCGVDDFDHGSELDGALAGVIHQLAGEQQQCGTQALAAAGAKVFADFRNRVHAGNGVAAELALNGSEVVVQQIENFFGVASYGCVQSVALSVGTVIRKLHVNAEIVLPQHRNDVLQCIAIFAADANYITLNGSLDLLLGILNELDDVARLFDRNALLHGDALAHGRTRRLFDGAIGERLQRNAALYQLALQDIVDRLQLVVVSRGEHERLFAVHLDVGLRVLQVVTGVNFLQRLLDGVGNLLQVHFTDNVE